MHFRSDNTAPAAAEILAALASANDQFATAYGDDALSKQLNVKFGELFEHEVRVFTVATGTAANAISLASVTPPWGQVFCHREAHIERDECGAPEFYAGGAKLALIDGANAKIGAASLNEALNRSAGDIHSPKAAAVSISQTTERGCVYTPAETAALGEITRSQGLALHVDGARFGNAVAALGCKPADVTWRAGVDILSFGATKNGAIAAEAIVVFDSARAEEIARRRKRGGHLFSKGRYAAAQLLAYIDSGLWLKLATRANMLAARIGEAAAPWLSAPVQTNQIFFKPGAERVARLRAAGVEFLDWGARGSGEVRLVVSWCQPEAEVDALVKLLTSMR